MQARHYTCRRHKNPREVCQRAEQDNQGHEPRNMKLVVSLIKVCQRQAGMLAHGCAFECSLLSFCVCVGKRACICI